MDRLVKTRIVKHIRDLSIDEISNNVAYSKRMTGFISFKNIQVNRWCSELFENLDNFEQLRNLITYNLASIKNNKLEQAVRDRCTVMDPRKYWCVRFH